MTHSKLASISIVSVLCLVVAAPALTFATAPAAAATNSDTADTYVVEQNGECIQLEPHGDGSETVEEFYDYRNPTTEPPGYHWSSHGTMDIQENQVSKLFVHNGSEGTSLVFLHDKAGEGEAYGSTTTLDISQLPEGSWAVRDDTYTYNNDTEDDEWEVGDSSASIDWKWRENRSDGGAYRGLHNMGAEDAIVVDPGFNEDADRWGTWGWSGDAENRTTEWVARSADGTETTLDMSQEITVERGICGEDETAPEASADASPTTAAPGETVTFDASDSTDNVGVERYEWDVDGDGTVDATGETVTHAYESNGSYEAVLTVADGAGNENTDAVTVTVEETDDPPTAALQATPESAAPGETVTLDASGSTDDEEIVEYRWDVSGNGTVDTTTADPAIERNFSATGDHTVTVTVVDTSDQTASDSAVVTVSDDSPPTARASADPTTVTAGNEVTFDASDSNDSQGIAGYSWAFGDGTTADGETVTHAYAESGTYDATLTVTDDAGNQDTGTVSITVDPADDSDEGDDSDDSDGSDGSDDSGDSDDSDDSNDSDDADDSDDSNSGAPSGGNSGGSVGGAPPADESPSASAAESGDGQLVVTIENAAAGEAVSADAPGGETGTGLRSIELVPATDADELNVTLVPSNDVSAPTGTDAGLYELRTEDGTDVERVTYEFAVDRADLGESGELRVLATNGSGVTAVDHSVVENGSTMVVEATTGDVDRVVLAAAAPDVSAAGVTTDGEATAGEPVTIETTLANDGHADANETVELAVDGAVVDSKRVTVPAGGEATVSFETTFEEAGDARVSVAGAEHTVSVASTDEPTDTERSTATESAMDDSPTDTEVSTTEPTSTSNTSLAIAGFGVLAIGAAALIRVL